MAENSRGFITDEQMSIDQRNMDRQYDGTGGITAESTDGQAVADQTDARVDNNSGLGAGAETGQSGRDQAGEVRGADTGAVRSPEPAVSPEPEFTPEVAGAARPPTVETKEKPGKKLKKTRMDVASYTPINMGGGSKLP